MEWYEQQPGYRDKVRWEMNHGLCDFSCVTALVAYSVCRWFGCCCTLCVTLSSMLCLHRALIPWFYACVSAAGSAAWLSAAPVVMGNSAQHAQLPALVCMLVCKLVLTACCLCLTLDVQVVQFLAIACLSLAAASLFLLTTPIIIGECHCWMQFMISLIRSGGVDPPGAHDMGEGLG